VISDFAFAYCELLNNLQFNQGDLHTTRVEITGYVAFLNCPFGRIHCQDSSNRHNNCTILFPFAQIVWRTRGTGISAHSQFAALKKLERLDFLQIL
jgi:hypothetical protein